MTRANVTAIGAALDNPQDVPRLVDAGDPGPDFERGKTERPPFPPGCPVKPLGIRSEMDGTIRCYYLDVKGQLVGLEANNKHGKNSLIALFGPESWWLEAKFPQWSAPKFEGRGASRRQVAAPEIVGFDQAEASRAMIEECVRRGIFDPAGRLRGRGAHELEGEDGSVRLALHLGDSVLAPRWRAGGRAGEWEFHEPGLIEGFVYPAGDPMPRPAANNVPPRAAIALTQLFQTWPWRRGLLDVRLLLGWLAAAPFGGALFWRPNIWITGPAGSGKSTLNGDDGVMFRILGRGVFSTANASSAAIRQSLKNSTIPVMFDEIEASADNRRVMEVVELARLASSGGKAHRGGQDHSAHEFTIRSCFQFSSINIPPLEAQDRSRLAILELMRFPAGAKMPDLSRHNFATYGRELMRRMIDQWPRLAPTKAVFHEALAASGHSARACDQFGTLLACADLVMNDELPDDEEVHEWVSRCVPQKLAEVSEATADEVACLDHLMTTMAQARGGDERETLASWIGRAVQTAVAPLYDGDATGSAEKSMDRLQQHGLKIVNAVYRPDEFDAGGALARPARWGSREFDAKEPGYLAIANTHQAINGFYAGTKWQRIHNQSLSRLAGTVAAELKIGKVKTRAMLIPLAHVLDETELPDASKPGAAAAWLVANGPPVDAIGGAK